MLALFSLGDGKGLNLEEVLNTWAKMTLCPKCGSKEGFWLGVKRSHAYVQCKSCGANFELYQVYSLDGKSEREKSLHASKFFRK